VGAPLLLFEDEMKNLIGDDETVQLPTAPAALTSGVGVLVGTSLFGVAINDSANGAAVPVLQMTGKVTLAKTSALAISIGDILFWDDTNKVVFKTVGTNKEVGIAITDAANPSATVDVYLTPTVRASTAA